MASFMAAASGYSSGGQLISGSAPTDPMNPIMMMMNGFNGFGAIPQHPGLPPLFSLQHNSASTFLGASPPVMGSSPIK